MVLLDALRDANSKLACPRAFADRNAKRSGVQLYCCQNSLFMPFPEVCHEAAANFSKAGDEPLHVGKEKEKDLQKHRF